MKPLGKLPEFLEELKEHKGYFKWPSGAKLATMPRDYVDPRVARLAPPPVEDLSAAQLAALREGLEEIVALPFTEARAKLATTTAVGFLVDRLVPVESVLEPRSTGAVLEETASLEADVEACAAGGDWVGEYVASRMRGLLCGRMFMDKAMASVENCVRLSQLHADPDAEQQAYNDLGTLCAQSNLTFRAIAYDELCLDLAVKEGNKLWECVASFNLASMHYLCAYFDKAIKHLERARELMDRVGAAEKLAVVDTNMAMFKRVRKQAQAKKELEEAIKAKAAAKKAKEQAMMGGGSSSSGKKRK
jgi:hypothetical protein